VSARYAIYFAPAADSALARFGAGWLGRDNETDTSIPQWSVAGIPSSRLQEITATARHYGFHATLKPPFALAPGATSERLDADLAAFAKKQKSITRLALKIGSLDGFLVLLLAEESLEVRNLAAACVREFDAFRAPPTIEELERRRRVPLTDLEDALLQRWGYPYVMEAFRFHMTLTCRLDDTERSPIESTLHTRFATNATGDVAIDAISLFHQETRDSAFRLLRRYPFADAASRNMPTKASTERDSGPSFTSDRTSLPSR
jgi:putative phosphonate metabolism protein